jgi:EmrB/QacA subfamily drug resistance transporter
VTAAATATDTVAAPAADRRRVLVVIGGLMLVMLLASLDQTIVSTALPTIVGDLGGLDHISWVVTAYLLAITIVTPLYGKLGDLVGRKRVLQAALVLFLIGSVLCGLSQDMTQLIAFRAIQGLGGGGLMVSAQAAVGDVVSPRERGRYMGFFGAVFGVSSVAGPLIGGFFTTHLSWRFIFYVNLPLGALALVVLAITLPDARERARRSVDYLGTLLLAVGLTSLVLLTTLGGNTYAWGSGEIVALGVLSVGALVGFVLVERRAEEPILDPALFRNRVFAVTAAVGLVVGFALFGSLTYLPLFQQVVRGLSPTASGLQLVPLMAGVLTASIISGRVISATGRYKIFPIAGTATAAVGLLLLSRLNEGTSTLTAGLFMLIFGVGLGLVMQVLVLAAQNAVPYEQLGVATSGATLFRSIGGSLGTAVLGAIFTNRLAGELATELPPGPATRSLESGQIDPAQLGRLPGPIHEAYLQSFTDTLSTVFLVAAAVVAVAFLLTFLLEERPLRKTVETAGVGEAFASPRDRDSLRELALQLSSLAGRERTRRFIQRTVAHAGLDLSPAETWLLGVVARTGRADPAALATAHRLDERVLADALDGLRRRALVAAAPGEDASALALTDAGRDTAAKLLAARNECLTQLVADWSPNADERVAPVLASLARELAAAAPRRGDDARAAAAA